MAMPNAFVIYPPGAGGNHVKNIMCLSGHWINSADLDPTVYDAQDRCPGEVWCVGGRNLQEIFFQRIQANPGSSSVLAAHFGELVAYQREFHQVPDVRLIILTMQRETTRRALQTRQDRLGQTIHPYWLDEELVWCYRTYMFERYFGVSQQHCLEIEIQDLWSQHAPQNVFDVIAQFLNIRIPVEPTALLHNKWLKSNQFI